MNRIAFVDCETTGLKPGFHEITDLAILVTDAEGYPVVDWHSYIQPVYMDRADPTALEIGHYDEEKWAEANPFDAHAQEVQELLSGNTLVAHNVSFDKRFIEAGLESSGLKPSWRHEVCTLKLAKNSFKCRGLKSKKLGIVAEHLGVKILNAHSALDDAKACREIYFRLTGEDNSNAKWRALYSTFQEIQLLNPRGVRLIEDIESELVGISRQEEPGMFGQDAWLRIAAKALRIYTQGTLDGDAKLLTSLKGAT